MIIIGEERCSIHKRIVWMEDMGACFRREVKNEKSNCLLGYKSFCLNPGLMQYYCLVMIYSRFCKDIL